jgi:uncharacterized YigZ family protein
MYQYKTIANTASFELKDRGSRFLAIAYPIRQANDAKAILKTLRAEHPKANHLCYAYRSGFDKFNYRAVDDGEPSGSAGKPILGAIDSLMLTNVLLVVVRYFGGTLLGVPGLINAYKSSAHEALLLANVIEKERCVQYHCEFDYQLMGSVNQLVNRYQLEILKIENSLFCSATIEIPMSKADGVLQILNDMIGMKITKQEAE